MKYYKYTALLFLSPCISAAEFSLNIATRAYAMHTVQLLTAFVLLTILLRKSIGHQARLNWFFGAIALLYISSNLQVFQRFFASPGSILHSATGLSILFVYFAVYWIKTWNKKQV